MSAGVIAASRKRATGPAPLFANTDAPTAETSGWSSVTMGVVFSTSTNLAATAFLHKLWPTAWDTFLFRIWDNATQTSIASASHYRPDTPGRTELPEPVILAAGGTYTVSVFHTVGLVQAASGVAPVTTIPGVSVVQRRYRTQDRFPTTGTSTWYGLVNLEVEPA